MPHMRAGCAPRRFERYAARAPRAAARCPRVHSGASRLLVCTGRRQRAATGSSCCGDAAAAHTTPAPLLAGTQVPAARAAATAPTQPRRSAARAADARTRGQGAAAARGGGQRRMPTRGAAAHMQRLRICCCTHARQPSVMHQKHLRTCAAPSAGAVCASLHLESVPAACCRAPLRHALAARLTRHRQRRASPSGCRQRQACAAKASAAPPAHIARCDRGSGAAMASAAASAVRAGPAAVRERRIARRLPRHSTQVPSPGRHKNRHAARARRRAALAACRPAQRGDAGGARCATRVGPRRSGVAGARDPSAAAGPQQHRSSTRVSAWRCASAHALPPRDGRGCCARRERRRGCAVRTGSYCGDARPGARQRARRSAFAARARRLRAQDTRRAALARREAGAGGVAAFQVRPAIVAPRKRPSGHAAADAEQLAAALATRHKGAG